MSNIEKRYQEAKERYAELGIDTEAAINRLQKIKLSVHVWQGDDVKGLLNPYGELTGGIQSTGEYPGAAHTASQLRSDLEEAYSLIPGKHKVNLHAMYPDTTEKVDLDTLESRHFTPWVQWAKEQGIGIDFNPTFFSHPMYKDGYTLSHPDKSVRDYWIEHGKRTRKISEYMGKELGQVSINNFWMPDGSKDNPVDRLAPRIRLEESLDEIFKEGLDERYTLDALEQKLFGIGAEAYTVGSHEFYIGYAVSRGKVLNLDAGHFHPTEEVSNKLTALWPFIDKGIMLHVSRPVRWDSDHVVTQDDALQGTANEVIRNHFDESGRFFIGMEFFDASINRIAAWVIGTRNAQVALLRAMLEPTQELREAENEFDYTKRLVYTEELKNYPVGDVWNYFCEKNNVPIGLNWYPKVKDYERNVLLKRK
ncbi:L-rhamnose isomerase [Tetragenococcus halophilus]|nr:L-rhamnose isomerase [Tetragenococcus halophilus]